MQSHKQVPDLTKHVHMRKYGLEQGQQYDEANTLLEPNNFIPSWEDGGEEATEVSTALRKLREDYDYIKLKRVQRESEKELLLKEIKKAKEEFKRVCKESGGGKLDMEFTEANLAHQERQHDTMKMQGMCFNYMLDRMKRDLISLTLQINDNSESLRSKLSINDDEQTKQMKSREQKLQSQFRLDSLMRQLTRDQQKRQERITALNISIKNKEEAIQKRNERKMRQNKIREEAQNESKDQNEIQMRAECLVQKIWSQFFKRRMEREMKAHQETENAFMQIRACAGNDDVKEIVSKFLTREQTYKSLIEQTNKSEAKYDQLKIENEEKNNRLHELELNLDNKKKLGFEDPRAADRTMAHQLREHKDDTNIKEQEFKRLSEELDQLRVHLEQLKQRKVNIQLINDQVGGWTSRVGSKLADQLDDHTLANKNAPLLQQFKNIATMVHQQLNQIKDSRPEGDDDSEELESLNVKELVNDFATDEFVHKNVRVRPQSSYSQAGGQGQSSIADGGHHVGGDDEDKKFNSEVLYDITQQRHELKETMRRQEAEKILEFEKAEKKKKAKQ